MTHQAPGLITERGRHSATSVRVPAQSSLVMSSRWVEAGLELRQKDSGSHTQAVGMSSGHVSFNIY